VIVGPDVKDEPIFAPRLRPAAMRELAEHVLLTSRQTHTTIANRVRISHHTVGSGCTAPAASGPPPGGCIHVVFADNRRGR
jgi:hypothetical protein